MIPGIGLMIDDCTETAIKADRLYNYGKGNEGRTVPRQPAFVSGWACFLLHNDQSDGWALGRALAPVIGIQLRLALGEVRFQH